MIMGNSVFLTSIVTPWDALLGIIAVLQWHTQCFQHVTNTAVVEDYFLFSALPIKGAKIKAC